MKAMCMASLTVCLAGAWLGSAIAPHTLTLLGPPHDRLRAGLPDGFNRSRCGHSWKRAHPCVGLTPHQSGAWVSTLFILPHAISHTWPSLDHAQHTHPLWPVLPAPASHIRGAATSILPHLTNSFVGVVLARRITHLLSVHTLTR
jgi:hypothetical protein